MKLKKTTIRWLVIFFIALVGIFIFTKIQQGSLPEQIVKQVEFKKMLGLKGPSPEKLKSYRSVKGVLDIQHWVTAKGANVYFVQVPTLPMVDIEVLFNAGASVEAKQGGTAYLTNALLSDGTKEWNADEIARRFDSVGAQYSAQVERDMAVVRLRSLSDIKPLRYAFETLQEILTHPNFPESGFNREKMNALSALKQQAQKPQQVASRLFYSLLYPNQPYSNWVLGDEASINALTLAEIKAFYQKYYVAKNATVVIVGDVKAEDADAIAQGLTNHLPEGQKPPALPQVAQIQQKTVKNVVFPSEQTHILMGMPGVKYNDPDYYALLVGNHILGGNGSVTRLFNIVRNQQGLAYSVYSYFMPMREQGPFVLGCQTRNSQAAKSQGLIETILTDFVKQGPTEEELLQAKKNLLGGFALHFDSNEAITNQVAKLGFYELPLDYFNQFKASVEKLTIKDIQQAFAKRINPEHLVIVTVGGKEG